MEKKRGDNLEKADELLRFAIENGMIDIEGLQQQKAMKERKEKLKQHKFSVWEGKSDGKWYTYIPDDTKPNGRKLVKRKTRKEIEDCIVEAVDKSEYTPTIQSVFEEWNDKRLEREQISKSTHLRNNQVFRRHYASFGDKKIGKLSHEDLVDFLENEICVNHLKPKAWANLKGITAGFMRYAKRKGLTTVFVEEVFSDMDISKSSFDTSKKLEEDEVFSDEEYPIILNYLMENTDSKNLALLFIFVTGLRRGECVALKWSDFYDDGSFRVNRTETRYVENGRYIFGIKESPKTEAGRRRIVIPDAFVWVLDEIHKLGGEEFLFIRPNGVRVKSQDLADRLNLVCKKCGITPKSPHKIRKTYASILLDAGVDHKLIMQQLGHANINTTELFYYRNRKNIETKKSIISNIAEFQLGNQK